MRERPSMNRFPSVPIVLVLASVLLAGCTDDEPDPVAGADPSSSAPSNPSDTASYDVVPTSGSLVPGSWAMWPVGGDDDTPLPLLDVPDGWEAGGPWMFARHRAMGYWVVTGVIKHACSGRETLEAGTTPEDFAEGLAGLSAFTTTEPEPVTLDGYDGVYLELTTPNGVDYGSCVDGSLFVFEAGLTGARHISEPGWTDRYWILDVDGLRVVLQAGANRRATRAEVQEQKAMWESVEFVDPM
jgi:hypothetical protein